MKLLHIHGRRWFERVNGNTYHTCEIWVDGDHVHKVPFTYGYGSQYEQSAQDWLVKNGYFPGMERRKWGGYPCMSIWCRDHGIKYVNEVDDVARKRDL